MSKKMEMPLYDRFKVVEIEKVIPHVLEHIHRPAKPTFRVPIEGEEVGVTSIRLRTFATKGLVCAQCGLVGSFFAIERGPKNTGPYHLNLWAINAKGEEIIMTHDHILARSLNGVDSLENCQTMCGPCNWKKGQEEGVAYLRLGGKRNGKRKLRDEKSALVDGKIPPRTECPFTSECSTYQAGACKHMGSEHTNAFSCASARGFDILQRDGLMGSALK